MTSSNSFDPLPPDGPNALVGPATMLEITKSSSSRQFPAVMYSPWFKWSLVLSVATLAITLIVHHSSHSSSSNANQTLTPAQAAMAQAQLERQLTTTGNALQKAGYDPRVVAQAHHQTALIYGTEIVERTIPATGQTPNSTPPLYVTGSSLPDQYASLEKVDAQAYLQSLSVHPTARDITKNTAVVHALDTETAN